MARLMLRTDRELTRWVLDRQESSPAPLVCQGAGAGQTGERYQEIRGAAGTANIIPSPIFMQELLKQTPPSSLLSPGLLPAKNKTPHGDAGLC
jgi:hypothetical protein